MPASLPPGRHGVHGLGRIAQLVEQLTLNQRVQGSSPCAPTTLSKQTRDELRFNPERSRVYIAAANAKDNTMTEREAQRAAARLESETWRFIAVSF